jgi:hypothetical protein
MKKAAVIFARSADSHSYRYRLRRDWDLSEPRSLVNFIMLNPSTADAETDDPTVRRCIGFAKAWGFNGLRVTNLYGLRSTDPRLLRTDPEPIGAENNFYIGATALASDLVVAAWGVRGGRRAVKVLELIKDLEVDLKAIHLTKSGHPSHPLYLPATCRPVPFPTSRSKDIACVDDIERSDTAAL